jgi:integrase
MRSRITFGVQFVLRPNKNKTSGLVYARITVGSKRIEISLKKTIEEEHWNKVKGSAKGSSSEIKNFNNYLDQVRFKLNEAFRELQINNQEITAERIKSLFLGEDNEHTICEIFDYHNTSQKGVLEYGTLKNYYTTKKYLKLFLETVYKTSDIKLSQINYKFIVDFECFLGNFKPNDDPQPIGNNGIMKHQQRLKKVLNLGVKMEWLRKNPFDAYELKFKKVDRGYLELEELTKIENKKFKLERLQLIKDLFIFSCYTGLSYIDAMNLTPAKLITGIDGQIWINSQREKTQVSVRVPLLPTAHEIVEKYKTNPKAISRGSVFPLISNQKLNSYLKEIGDLCQIDKNLTFHLARHTFATTVTLSNGVPIESVSSMLGHTSIKTTQIYAKVVEKKVSQDMADLRNKLYGTNLIKQGAEKCL